MALSPTVLSSLIDANLAGSSDYAGWTQRAAFKAQLLDAIAAAVVSHITSSAVVSSTVTVTSVSGVTAGAGVSGPGTGTATGTIA